MRLNWLYFKWTETNLSVLMALLLSFINHFGWLFQKILLPFYKIKDCYNRGQLCKSMNVGFIGLIYKMKGSNCDLRNWGTINLLNVDYKMLAKVFTNGLKKHASWHVMNKHVGFQGETLTTIWHFCVIPSTTWMGTIWKLLFWVSIKKKPLIHVKCRLTWKNGNSFPIHWLD